MCSESHPVQRVYGGFRPRARKKRYWWDFDRDRQNLGFSVRGRHCFSSQEQSSSRGYDEDDKEFPKKREKWYYVLIKRKLWCAIGLVERK